jgi:signal transduction histidine kinase/DNA-binding response OmpR family regulator
MDTSLMNHVAPASGRPVRDIAANERDGGPIPHDEGKVNILVVDDQPDKLLVYETVLADLGENIVAAKSGEEALKHMLRSEFAVVLLDVNMPTMDGFETAALIRGRRQMAHTPIIFITAFGDDMRSAHGYSLGAVDFILAPIVPDVLRTKVKVFVQLFRMTEQIKRQAEDRVRLTREQAARAAAEDSIRRSSLLGEVSHTLSSSLDLDSRGHGLTQLAVPYLADCCVLTIIDDSGQVLDSELAWTSATRESSASQSALISQLLDEELREAMTSALQKGGVERVRFSGGLSALRVTKAGQATNSLVELDFSIDHVAVFPLLARGRTLGALLLGFAAGRPFGASQESLASEFAERVAIGLDNALLYSRIREADRRKDEFLAMLGHELRNPLAPIRNAVEIMRLSKSASPVHDEVREVIGREVHHLSRLVDDLLDVSRITRGKIKLGLVALDLNVLMSTVSESMRPLLDSRQQVLEVSPAQEPIWVHGDPVRLTQVIVNLVDNAAKFTPDGGRIWLVAKRLGDECELTVADNGIGIACDTLPDIFTLFTQGERSLDRRQGGLGIGLALVKNLVELHGGSIRAFSKGVGNGSEFIIRLPLLKAVPVADDSTPSDEQRSDVCHRILVVDDHVGSATTLATLLRMLGHDVEIAHNGRDALDQAGRFCPRVAILDIGLPDMNGYELAARLLQLPETRDSTLVALTGYGQDEDRRRAEEAGFHHHVIKPVERKTLVAILKSVAA